MNYLPTLRQLGYLIALHEHRHFGHAAEASNVSQSTLSAAIRELETLLDAHLVERSRRAVHFTTLGEKVVERARGVLSGATGLTELVRAEREPLSGTLRLGVIPTIAPFLLPVTMAPLRRAWPKLKLRLVENFSHMICAGLEAGDLDLLLMALPFPCGDVEVLTLFEDTFFVALPKKDASRFGASIAPAELDPKELLLLEEGHCLRDHALEVCDMRDERAGASILGTSLHTLIQMVDNGLGITLVPEMAIDSGLLKGTSVVVRPLKSDRPTSRAIGLVWRKGSPLADEFRLFGQALVTSYRGD